MNLLQLPLVLRSGAILPNRLAKSAMSERLAGSDRAPNAPLARLYSQWSAGGTGLLITGNVMVDRERLGEPGNVAIEDDRDLAALTAWAKAATAAGNHAWMQINHPGRQSPRTLDPHPVAPSVVPMAGAYGAFATPRALEDEEITAIIERFARAAEIARAAGFTGVQVHAAHGYLISQFLSPRTNLRTDRWGGDLAGRSAFLLAIVRAIRARVGPAFPVGVKLNTADFQRGGFAADEAAEVAVLLDREGIDLLELSGGTYERAAMFAEKASTQSREAFFLEQAEAIRARVAVPLLLTGGFRSRAAMEAAIASGAVDVIGLARPLAVEPDLSARLLSGDADRAVPVALNTGIPALDALLIGAWYQVQIERMARGLPADPRASRVYAVAWYLRDQWRGRRRAYQPTPSPMLAVPLQVS
jgi:2,4-dienoyl-CoA reductase-like NADH-dependent reductase (Old Yellow Enzyme family)